MAANNSRNSSLIAFAHPTWQYVVVVAVFAFVAWCIYIEATD